MWGPGGRFCFQRRLQHPLCSSSVGGCHPSEGRFESSPLHLSWPRTDFDHENAEDGALEMLCSSSSLHKESCAERERDPANPRCQPPQSQVLQCQPPGISAYQPNVEQDYPPESCPGSRPTGFCTNKMVFT